MASQGLRAPSTMPAKLDGPSDETIHTTSKHPWLTAERGWVTAGDLHAGEHVVRMDGGDATIMAVRVISGAATMYNLQVSEVHTFAVGKGQYVVHNCALARSVPLGFKSFGQFRQFSKAIRGGLNRAGYGDADAAFTGSSVTGYGFSSGKAFGAHSDFDIAIVHDGLFNRAKAAGVEIRGGVRTGPIHENNPALGQLGLSRMHAKLTRLAGRQVNFMIYRDLDSLRMRGPSIRIRPN